MLLSPPNSECAPVLVSFMLCSIILFFFQSKDDIRDVGGTLIHFCFFFFQAEDGIRDVAVTGVQTCALPIYRRCRAGVLASANGFHSGAGSGIPDHHRSASSRSDARTDRGGGEAGDRYHPQYEIGRASCRERV